MAVADASTLIHNKDKTDDQVHSAADSNIVTTFTDDVREQDKQDVHDSLLLARLAATKNFNVKEKPNDWYQHFLSVLSNVGWTVKEFGFRKLQHSSKLSFRDFVVHNLSKLATEKETTVINKSLHNVLSSHRPKHGEELSFESKKGYFQVSVASRRSRDAGLSVLVNGYYFSMDSHTEHSSSRMQVKVSELHLYVSTTLMELNETIYGQVREDIKKKLLEHSKKRDEKPTTCKD